MIHFDAIIQKFGKQGEKTGWTYINIPGELAAKLNPDNRKSFRVKGRLDAHGISGATLLPMGGGDYILPLNAGMRKGIGKPLGASIRVCFEIDRRELQPPPELMECLQDEPEALRIFNALPKSHRNYYTNWINAAKTEPTKAKRIAATIEAMLKQWDFGQTVRSMRDTQDKA
ncbi:MAG TPA: YdeI/OmpD-associated family protein [Flavisolibacter sp.]|nr:YdeI/OmpD-associated family protein [Flavisolibacter sp.]